MDRSREYAKSRHRIDYSVIFIERAYHRGRDGTISPTDVYIIGAEVFCARGDATLSGIRGSTPSSSYYRWTYGPPESLPAGYLEIDANSGTYFGTSVSIEESREMTAIFAREPGSRATDFTSITPS